MNNLLFGLVLVIVGSFPESAADIDIVSKETCGMNFTSESGIIRLSTGPSTTVPPKTSCSWLIISNNTENHTIFLVFDEILLQPDDNLIIQSDGKPLKFDNPFKNTLVPGAFSFLTGKSIIDVTLTTTAATGFRKFQMHYYSNSECNHNFTTALSGSLQTPSYDSESYPMPIKCVFNVAVQDKDANYLSLRLNQFKFTQGTVDITGDEKNPDSSFNATSFPDYEFLSKDTIDITVSITNNSAIPEIFKVNYNSVSSKCSGKVRLESSTGLTQHLVSPNKNDIQGMMMDFTGIDHRQLTCQWSVECTTGKVISVQLKNVSLPSTMDQLLILDGPNRSSAFLLDLNSDSKDKFKDKIIYSSGNQLWLSGSSLDLDIDFLIDLDVTESSGGYKHGSGDVFLKNSDSSTFLLEVESGKQVKLMIDLTSLKLDSGGKINFYSDFLTNIDPFASLVAGSNIPKFVVSPTEKMRIRTESFKSSVLNASFNGTELGCYRFASGSGDTYSVTGNCNSTCAWTVEPKKDSAEGSFAFHFSTLSLSENDIVLIRKMDAAQTFVANLTSPMSYMPDLWLPASDGAFFQVMRENCEINSTVLKASYSFTQECQATLEPKLGDIVQLSSPNYPNQYPLGADCTWTVKLPATGVFLHVTLKDLQLASENHTLTFYKMEAGKKEKLEAFNLNSSLPDDYAVMSDLIVEFNTNMETPFKSHIGFSMSVAVVEYGFVTNNKSGIIQTPEYPKPVENKSRFSWIVKVPSNNTGQAIIHFNFPNNTNHTDLDKTLKLFDGASLRSPVIANYTASMNMSRTNTLIFLYQRTNLSIPGPNFSISYESFACNMSLLCETTKICMHVNWICNGINECGDYSDEKNCEGVLPPPPTPAPEPRPRVKGASAGVLAASVVGGLVLGAFLGVAAPYAYRVFRNRREGTYSAINN